MLAKNTYVYAEWQSVHFGEETTAFGGESLKVEPKNTFGLVGMGWTF